MTSFLRWRSDEFTTVKDCVSFYVRFIRYVFLNWFVVKVAFMGFKLAINGCAVFVVFFT